MAGFMATVAETDDQHWPSPAIGWAWVGVLLLAYTSSFIDRQILSLLVDPIRSDLQISDTQFSLLSGLAFAIFYSTMGLPLGALIDRKPRRLVASLGALSWSAATVLCGLSKTYGTMLMARACVSVGEASLAPAAASLLADCFRPARLGRAISVYLLGAGLGAGLALFLGGEIIAYVENSPPLTLPLYGELKPWQTVFVIVGLIGLPVTALMWLLPEPARRGAGSAAGAPSWKEAFGFLRARGALMIPFMGGGICYGMVTMAILGWAPAFYMRHHGMAADQVGTWLGIATVVGLWSGLIGGATISEWMTARGSQVSHLHTAALGMGIAAMASVGAMLVPSSTLSLMLLAVAMAGCSMPVGVANALLQIVTPNRLRGRMTALLFGITNIFGATFGPLFPALLTDYVLRDETRIGEGIAIVGGVVGTVGVLLYLRAARAYGASAQPLVERTT